MMDESDLRFIDHKAYYQGGPDAGDGLSVDKDGICTLVYPGEHSGRMQGGYRTPVRRRKHRQRRLWSQQLLKQERWARLNYHQAKRLLGRIDRDNFAREVEKALEELAANGEIQKNPDGTYQKIETLEDKLIKRRRGHAG
jgi:hypothetical protein